MELPEGLIPDDDLVITARLWVAGDDVPYPSGPFMPDFVAAQVDPHYVACIAVMGDNMLGPPHAVYVGRSGVHWELTTPPTSLLDSPLATLPWQVYEHSDTVWAYDL